MIDYGTIPDDTIDVVVLKTAFLNAAISASLPQLMNDSLGNMVKVVAP